MSTAREARTSATERKKWVVSEMWMASLTCGLVEQLLEAGAVERRHGGRGRRPILVGGGANVESLGSCPAAHVTF